MSSVTSSWRRRRQAARAQRELAKALSRSSTPAMRDELLSLASAGSQFMNITR